VGKTTLASNLAIALANANFRVAFVDGDMGLANSQLAFGIPVEFHLGHLLSGAKSIQEIVVKTRHGISVLPGASGDSSIAKLSDTQLDCFIQSFDDFSEPLDFLLVDVGAGIGSTVIGLLEACQEVFVIAKDEPSSIADAYGLVKVLMKDQNYQAISVIPNCVKSESHGNQVFRRINGASEKFLNGSLTELPSIPVSELMLEAQRKYKPLMDLFPASPLAGAFRTLSRAVSTQDRLTHAGTRMFCRGKLK